jgi:hypothetical protein
MSALAIANGRTNPTWDGWRSTAALREGFTLALRPRSDD